jgi:hypothetical protein
MNSGRTIFAISLIAIFLLTAWRQPSSSYACEDEAKITQVPRFGRLMHDPQWMEWPSRMADPDWNSGFYYDWYPETVKLTTGPKSGDGAFNYTREWLEYLRELQPNDLAATWIARVAAGLFNARNEFIPILNLDQLENQPIAESISSGGNVIKILEIKNGSARIEMLYLQKGPPNVSDVNYETKPWLVTKFTSVSLDGQLGNAGGIDVYFPNIAKVKKGYWVTMKRVELFPPVPFCGVVEGTLNVHTAPSIFASVTGRVTDGDAITIREYLPQGSDVWGRIDEGWILIEYLSRVGLPVYPTSWEMETRPPLDFD